MEGCADVQGHSRELALLQLVVRVCVQPALQELQPLDVHVLGQVVVSVQLMQGVVVTGAEPVQLELATTLPLLSSQE